MQEGEEEKVEEIQVLKKRTIDTEPFTRDPKVLPDFGELDEVKPAEPPKKRRRGRRPTKQVQIDEYF